MRKVMSIDAETNGLFKEMTVVHTDTEEKFLHVSSKEMGAKILSYEDFISCLGCLGCLGYEYII